MSPEEEKLFEEFKVALDATQLHTFNKYIKPEIDKINAFQVSINNVIKKNKIQNSLIYFMLMLVTINFILIVLLEAPRIKENIIKIISWM